MNLARYWPVWVVIAIHILNFATSLPLREAGTVRRFLLATLPEWCVFLWGILTLRGLIAWFDMPTGVRSLIELAVDTTICIAVILLLLIPRNLVARRIRMPTAFTLGAGVTIAAVYADIVFLLVWVLPWGP